jgi:hypothetical protein
MFAGWLIGSVLIVATSIIGYQLSRIADALERKKSHE